MSTQGRQAEVQPWGLYNETPYTLHTHRDPGSGSQAEAGGALTDERHGLGVDDAAGEQMEVILLAVHYHRVPGVVAALGTETRMSGWYPSVEADPTGACLASQPHSRPPLSLHGA